MFYRGVMDEFDRTFPILAHKSTGTECCGFIVVKVTGDAAELQCNECGVVVGVVHVAILRDIISLIPHVAKVVV
jgi:hypothetical protein